MSPSLPVFAPPLHIPICTCSRNAEKKGALHAFDFIIVTVDILYMDIASYASVLLLIVPLVLTSLSHMLIYTCSQSPHSMKGLLIGLLYAIKGLYQLLATLLVVPFDVGYTSHPSHVGQMSCGFYYYLVNIVIGLIAVLTYMWVAKKYKYRERDEICEVHRYAKEYYSNPQQEQYYNEPPDISSLAIHSV